MLTVPLGPEPTAAGRRRAALPHATHLPPAAFLTAAIILLHTFWGVVFFDACERRRYWALGLVVGSHLLTSGLVSWGQGPELERKELNGEWDGGEIHPHFLTFKNLF